MLLCFRDWFLGFSRRVSFPFPALFVHFCILVFDIFMEIVFLGFWSAILRVSHGYGVLEIQRRVVFHHVTEVDGE